MVREMRKVGPVVRKFLPRTFRLKFCDQVKKKESNKRIIGADELLQKRITNKSASDRNDVQNAG